VTPWVEMGMNASRLALILSGALAASAVHDDEAVRTSASELLAEIEPLHRQGRESGKPELLWYSHLPGSGAVSGSLNRLPTPSGATQLIDTRLGPSRGSCEFR
jgi:hypothetical protein